MCTSKVESIALDDVSNKFWIEMTKIMKNLAVMSLDSTQLVMAYRTCHNNKTTKGCAFLRLIMSRFNKDPCENVDYGTVFTGAMKPQQSCAAEYMRERTRKWDLSLAHANRVKSNFNADIAFDSVYAFAEALAVLSTLYWREVTRITHINGSNLLSCDLVRSGSYQGTVVF